MAVMYQEDTMGQALFFYIRATLRARQYNYCVLSTDKGTEAKTSYIVNKWQRQNLNLNPVLTFLRATFHEGQDFCVF